MDCNVVLQPESSAVLSCASVWSVPVVQSSSFTFFFLADPVWRARFFFLKHVDMQVVHRSGGQSDRVGLSATEHSYM